MTFAPNRGTLLGAASAHNVGSPPARLANLHHRWTMDLETLEFWVLNMTPRQLAAKLLERAGQERRDAQLVSFYVPEYAAPFAASTALNCFMRAATCVDQARAIRKAGYLA